MNITERYQELANNYESMLNRLVFILENTNPISDEEKIAILSFIELIGASFVALGEAVESVDPQALNDAISKSEELYATIIPVINKHPSILSAA